MSIPKRQAELDALVREYLTDPKPREDERNGHRTDGAPTERSDEEILALCRKAKNSAKFSALYDAGDTSAYDGDDSAADLALLGIFKFYTQDPLQLERLFDDSALGRRQKWRNRPDYRHRTIEKVIKALTETYTAPRSSGAKRLEKPGDGEEEERRPMSQHDVLNKEFKEIVDVDSERPATMPFNTTDMGNAERLVARHGEDLRYVHAWGRWLEYDETRWRVDDTGGVERRAKETARSIYGEAEKPGYAELRKEIGKHAIKTEARSSIEAMIALAKSEPGISVRPDRLDADPWLMNVGNGTIELRTGELREHGRGDLITKLAPGEYDPAAEAPTWQAVLERLLPSAELQRFFQRFVGYCLTGDTSEQVLVFLHGLGANGKSTIINALLDVLGDYGRQAAPELLTVKSNAHPTELADLKGARLVASVEVEEGKRLAEALVKQLTGGDRIKARRMREDFWEFEATHKILFSGNHKPVVRGADHAIWRRIKLVPFDVTIPDHEKDKKLPEKLRAERSGILAWAVCGCLDWQQNGLGEPEEVRAATNAYRAEMDVLAAFMDECCALHKDTHAGATPLYNAYKEWCAAAGESQKTQTSFGTMLGERGFENGKDPKTRRKVWYGIGLLADNEPDDGGGIPPENPPPNDPGAKQSKQSETVETISPPEVHKPLGEQNNCFAPPSTVSQGIPEAGALGGALTGEGAAPGDTSPELAEYLASPPEWLVNQARIARTDPALLNPTCSTIAYEVYGYAGRGAQIREAVAAWMRGAAV